MTITNYERREVAAMLREDIGLHTFAEIFGFYWTDESDWYWRDVTAKVADYVEPEPERTCRNLGGEEGTNFEHYDFGCSACGYCCDLSEPNYCPNCSARVID